MKLKSICLLGIFLVLLSGCQTKLDANAAPDGVQSLRLVLPEEGFHSLSSRDIEQAGMRIGDPDQVQLIFEGEPYPFWSEAAAEKNEFTLNFYVPTAGRYLTDQVFVLQKKDKGSPELKPGILILEKSNQIDTQTLVTTSTVFEQQEIYLSQASLDNPWLWKLIGQKEKAQFVLPLTGEPLIGQNMEIVVWSPSDAPANPDHAIHVWLNDTDLGEFDWEGAGSQTISISLNNQLLENENQVIVENAPLKDVLVQKNYIDKITLQVQKELNFGVEQNTFTGDGNTVAIRNASSDGVVVEQDPATGTIKTAAVNSGSSYSFKSINGNLYDWLPRESTLPVKNISALTWNTNLDQVDEDVDWLVIAPNDFFPEIQPLLALRQSQGLVTMLVDAQQIYDQYYGGSPQPQALTLFFESISTQWRTFPRYVLLVGDFSYDRKPYNAAISEIPSYFVASAFAGETASDLPLMDLNGDNLPDFVIGRLPVNHKSQLSNWVDKLTKYESKEMISGFDQIVAIADNQEAGFNQSAQQFLDHFSKDFSTTLYQPEQNEINANGTIKSFFNGSTDLLAYFGHGSVDIWGKDRLFAIDDVSQLNNQEMVPLIINLSCLTGYYIHPQNISLVEALLSQKNGGSLAMIAPTSLTFQSYQSILSAAFAYELQSDMNQRLGDMMKLTWRAMDPADSASLEVMQTFLLFGDPAMVIHQ